MNRLAIVLLVIGLLQMSGDGIERWLHPATGQAVKGIGAASTASPAPKVFSAVRGLETYSTRFFLEWSDRDGRPHRLELTPEVYARVQGPYNRRNVYGAVLAYGPLLATQERTRPMFRSVANHALSGEAPLLRELGIDPATIVYPITVRYEPAAGTELDPSLPRVVEVPIP
jgi:hypothetical protein